MDKYAVFGNPIKHSKSPAIHHKFAELLNEPLQYEAILAPIDGFSAAVNHFFASGGLGANVTMPFKEQAFEMCNQVSDRAKSAGAVNTLKKLANGELYGDNTDGAGLVNDLLNNDITLKGKHILLMGAGGAARGVLLPLIEQKPASITLVNRTKSKALQLAGLFSKHINIAVYDFPELPIANYDVVINSTSSSIEGVLPNITAEHIQSTSAVYDMVYSDDETIFIAWAKSHNQHAVLLDGIGMLIGQAAEAYNVWRHKTPPVDQVIKLAKNKAL